MTRWRVLAAVSIWLVVSLSLWATDSEPAVVVLAGIVAAGAVLVATTIDITRDIVASGWPPRRGQRVPSEDDSRVAELRRQMIGARKYESTELRDRLVVLLDDGPHDSTPALRDLRSGPVQRLGSRRSLEQIVDDLGKS